MSMAVQDKFGGGLKFVEFLSTMPSARQDFALAPNWDSDLASA
jgi:hypothetical protein